MSGWSDYGKAPSQGDGDAYIKKEEREEEASSQEEAGAKKCPGCQEEGGCSEGCG